MNENGVRGAFIKYIRRNLIIRDGPVRSCTTLDRDLTKLLRLKLMRHVKFDQYFTDTDSEC